MAMTPMARAQTAPHPQQKSQGKGLTCSVLMGLLLGLAIFAALIPVGGYIYFQATDLILPGVSVLRKPVGGLSAEDAGPSLTAGWQAEPPVVMLSTGAQTWPVPASALGIGIDGPATAQKALALGRSGDFSNIDTLWNGLELPPTLTFAPEAARATLQ